MNEVRHCGEFQIVSRLVKKLDGGVLISGRNKKKLKRQIFNFRNARVVFKGAAPARIAENVNVRF